MSQLPIEDYNLPERHQQLLSEQQPQHDILNNQGQDCRFDNNPVKIETNEATNDWRNTITADLRKDRACKIVKAIFPVPDPSVLQDRRFHNLVAYAKKVEGDMYERANCIDEYHYLLARKIYQVQQELEHKRQERRNRRIHQDQQNFGGVSGA